MTSKNEILKAIEDDDVIDVTVDERPQDRSRLRITLGRPAKGTKLFFPRVVKEEPELGVPIEDIDLIKKALRLAVVQREQGDEDDEGVYGLFRDKTVFQSGKAFVWLPAKSLLGGDEEAEAFFRAYYAFPYYVFGKKAPNRIAGRGVWFVNAKSDDSFSRSAIAGIEEASLDGCWYKWDTNLADSVYEFDPIKIAEGADVPLPPPVMTSTELIEFLVEYFPAGNIIDGPNHLFLQEMREEEELS